MRCPSCQREFPVGAVPPRFCPLCGRALPESTALAATQPAHLDRAHAIPLAAPAPPPDRVGPWRLLGLLGRGGMGSVHGAEEEGSGRRAAVKLVSPELLASREARERFRQEGRLASRIAHPRCVFVLAPPGLARGVARGGLSFRLAGLALVRRSGARATRIQWALRSLLLWGPFATLLWVAADTDNRQPHLSPAVRACALSLLPIYAIVALRFPRRGPLDVLLGTWVVRR